MDSVAQPGTDEEFLAWAVLRACSRGDAASADPIALALDGNEVRQVEVNHPDALVCRAASGEWSAAPMDPGALANTLALYLPLCGPGAMVVGHLGQSLDGFVGTAAGDSCFVNDDADIVHLHRMRALCDAVVVGGATVREDNPRLTTRRVSGSNPLRVVIDPRRELDPGARIFTDAEAPTLRVSTVAIPPTDANALRVCEDSRGYPDLAVLIAELRRRGVHRVFVEGGGITVSRFLQAGLLDRLQIAVAPFVIGNGRPGLRLPGTDELSQVRRPPHRSFRLGNDVLFDLDLRET